MHSRDEVKGNYKCYEQTGVICLGNEEGPNPLSVYPHPMKSNVYNNTQEEVVW